jgi:hypothetical protein
MMVKVRGAMRVKLKVRSDDGKGKGGDEGKVKGKGR